MQSEFQFNRDGHNCKRQAPKPVTDAATRFADLLTEQQPPPGISGNCLIFSGENFNAGDGEIVKPRRYALRLRGIEPPKGAKFIIKCKVAGCVRHLEVKKK